MAIGTNDAILKFGTTDAVDDTTTSAVNDAAMSAAADVTAWTNDDDAPSAKLVLRWQYPSGTIDGDIEVYARPINIDGTDDQPQPDATYKHAYVGKFVIDTGQAATTDTVYVTYISLWHLAMKTSQEYEFYLYNDSGVQMSANWDLDIVPSTIGPHA